jgi:hypothetical protein
MSKVLVRTSRKTRAHMPVIYKRGHLGDRRLSPKWSPARIASDTHEPSAAKPASRKDARSAVCLASRHVPGVPHGARSAQALHEGV